MRFSKLSILSLCSVAMLSLFVGACSSDDEPTDIESTRFIGANEKADNFRSESAQEYFVRGTTTITLDESFMDSTEDERVQAVRDLIPYKQVVIQYFLNTYLIDKSSHGDDEASKYGGFKALTKNGSYEDLNLSKETDLTYAFDFVQEIGGDFDLLVELGTRANAEPQTDGSWRLELKVGKVSSEDMQRLETGDTWFRDAPWSDFNPDSVEAELVDTQVLFLEEQERSDDAWIDYERLIEDGTVNIQAFYGWDYHGAYHIKHAEATYDWLRRNGFESPVDSWAKYADARAPLTKTMKVGGQDVEFQVTLWWGQPGSDTDPDTDAGGIVLEDAMRKSFTSDEIIIYSGHSGPWYGFALGNWRKTDEGDLDDSEIPGLDLPDKYQIVLAEGCDTYALGEAFWANPAKAGQKNLDIVTTTSFSNASTAATVTDFLGAIMKDNGEGVLEPVKYSTVLKDMDSNSHWFDTMYGVHGIDDNPKVRPFSNADLFCGGCDRDNDCGSGGRCIDLSAGAMCTFECTADSACGSGNVCRQTESGGWVQESFCMPESFTCR